MDNRSELNLQNVHPDLCKVIREAAQWPQPFIVVYGDRTEVEENEAVATGHSTTHHSRHISKNQKCKLACAVDVAAIIANAVSFAPGREAEVFGAIAKQIKAAALKFKIPLQWGGDPVGAWTPGVVSHFRDWGHFQLPYAEYP